MPAFIIIFAHIEQGRFVQNNDASFMETGIIDSTGILELINFLEKTYELKIEDDEIVPENLDSLVNVSNFLQKKLGRDNAEATPSGKEAG